MSFHYGCEGRKIKTCFEKYKERRKWQPTPVFLPGESHGWRAWWATVHGVAKSRTRLSDFTSLQYLIQIFLNYSFLWIYGIARSYGSAIFSLLRNLHNDHTNFHPHQQYRRFPFLHILSSSCYRRLFDDGHSDQSDGMPLCIFFPPKFWLFCLHTCLFFLIYFWLWWVFVLWGLFSSCAKQGLLFVDVHRLLIAVTSLVVEHRL